MDRSKLVCHHTGRQTELEHRIKFRIRSGFFKQLDQKTHVRQLLYDLSTQMCPTVPTLAKGNQLFYETANVGRCKLYFPVTLGLSLLDTNSDSCFVSRL